MVQKNCRIRRSDEGKGAECKSLIVTARDISQGQGQFISMMQKCGQLFQETGTKPSGGSRNKDSSMSTFFFPSLGVLLEKCQKHSFSSSLFSPSPALYFHLSKFLYKTR